MIFGAQVTFSIANHALLTKQAPRCRLGLDRLGSKADFALRLSHVRFATESGDDSGHWRMSALRR